MMSILKNTYNKLEEYIPYSALLFTSNNED